ncbi:hypothetical protein K440DRAFT_667495 [Wilcoxina mikolae CBS 423.85]|nr:hypothetical protein K440DRAFT_667495 [Wilcoxina mikolae CBS 423.85]
MASKNQHYVPVTLRTFTLLGFAVLCLIIIIGLEAMILAGHGRIRDMGLQDIISKRNAGHSVLRRWLVDQMEPGVTDHIAVRNDTQEIRRREFHIPHSNMYDSTVRHKRRDNTHVMSPIVPSQSMWGGVPIVDIVQQTANTATADLPMTPDVPVRRQADPTNILVTDTTNIVTTTQEIQTAKTEIPTNGMWATTVRLERRSTTFVVSPLVPPQDMWGHHPRPGFVQQTAEAAATDTPTTPEVPVRRQADPPNTVTDTTNAVTDTQDSQPLFFETPTNGMWATTVRLERRETVDVMSPNVPPSGRWGNDPRLGIVQRTADTATTDTPTTPEVPVRRQVDPTNSVTDQLISSSSSITANVNMPKIEVFGSDPVTGVPQSTDTFSTETSPLLPTPKTDAWVSDPVTGVPPSTDNPLTDTPITTMHEVPTDTIMTETPTTQETPATSTPTDTSPAGDTQPATTIENLTTDLSITPDSTTTTTPTQDSPNLNQNTVSSYTTSALSLSIEYTLRPTTQHHSEFTRTTSKHDTELHATPQPTPASGIFNENLGTKIAEKAEKYKGELLFFGLHSTPWLSKHRSILTLCFYSWTISDDTCGCPSRYALEDHRYRLQTYGAILCSLELEWPLAASLSETMGRVHLWRDKWTGLYCGTSSCIIGIDSNHGVAPGCDAVANTGSCGVTYLATRNILAKCLQAVLAVVVGLVLCLVVLQMGRKSMLYSEPWSIAGLSCLVADWSSVPEVFGSIESSDSTMTLCRKVVSSGGNYQLVESMNLQNGRLHVGIESTTELDKASIHGHLSSGENSKSSTAQIPRVERPLVLNGFVLFAYGIFVGGILAMILTYRWTSLLAYEKFMSGQGPRVRFFMIAVGIMIRSLWEPVEREVRHTEVFRKLSRRHRSPEATIFTDYTRVIPIVTELHAIRRGDFYVAFIGFVGLLIEALVVVLPGIPFDPTQTFKAYEDATWISVAVLTLVLFAVILVFFRRRNVCVPRLPFSIATLIAYLYAAKMLEDFVGLSVMNTKERNRRISALGKTYGFGWTTGQDGKTRVGVDEEELNFSYRYRY